MTTVVVFRALRSEVDAVASRRSAAAHPLRAAGDSADGGAEIILMPLVLHRQIGRAGPRKPLNRRFARRAAAASVSC